MKNILKTSPDSPIKIILCFCYLFAGLSMYGQANKIILYDNFEDSLKSVGIWGAPAKYAFTNGYTGKGIIFNNATVTNTMVSITLPLTGLPGSTIVLSASVKGENMQSSVSWLGMKVMLVITTKSGTKLYPQIVADTGTFGWKSKATVISIDPNATDVKLSIGIQQGSGKLWLDEIKIQIAEAAPAVLPARSSSIPINKCHHTIPILRGVNVSENITKSSVAELGHEWKANHIRWQIGGCSFPNGLLRSDFDSIMNKELILLDTIVKWCTQNKLLITLDLHSLSQGLFTTKAAQTRFINTWKSLATRYKNSTAVWAYDIANEPSYLEMETAPESGVLFWNSLADTIVKVIRKTDAVKPIMIESINYEYTMNNFKPIDFKDTNIVYSVHFYQPHAFTHQTLYGATNTYSYPGDVDGKIYNIDTLRKLLKPLKDFQEKYRVPIYIGEFSAIRWAPNNSAYNYLRDCIQIFEENGWDWCYHSFREYDGWSVEHTTDKNNLNVSPVETDREILLRSYFEKNTTVQPQPQPQPQSDISERNRKAALYPNPSSGKITIDISQLHLQQGTIHICNMEGISLMKKEICDENIIQIDISNFDDGIYICSILNENGTIVTRDKILKIGTR